MPWTDDTARRRSDAGNPCGPCGASGTLEAGTVAHYKRFVERYIADPAFEAAFQVSASAALESAGIAIDARILDPFRDPDLNRRIQEDGLQHPLVEVQREYLRILTDTTMVERLRPESIREARYRAWRARHHERTRGLFHKQHHDNMIHVPVAFELTRGCSGACPFCAFSPPPLQGVFEYTPGHARLWRAVQESIRDILGPVAGASVCYYATEPFDNPDYERFILDFHAVHGCLPHTTTASFLDHPARTRRFMALMRDVDRVSCRFSITSTKDLQRLHREFSAEELLEVYLCLNNRESKNLYCDSGRARSWKRHLPDTKIYADGSSSCLTGFLVNMVDRTIALIAPCNPTDRRPFGYQVYETATFDSADSFTDYVRDCINRHMPLAPPPDRPLRFRPDLEFEPVSNGFVLANRFQRRAFTGDAYLPSLGEMIHEGHATSRDLAAEFESFFVPAEYVTGAVQTMFDVGVLDDLPEGC